MPPTSVFDILSFVGSLGNLDLVLALRLSRYIAYEDIHGYLIVYRT